MTEINTRVLQLVHQWCWVCLWWELHKWGYYTCGDRDTVQIVTLYENYGERDTDGGENKSL